MPQSPECEHLLFHAEKWALWERIGPQISLRGGRGLLVSLSNLGIYSQGLKLVLFYDGEKKSGMLFKLKSDLNFK